MQLDLSQDLENFINQQVETDITYKDASEWIREAIREKINNDRQYHDKLSALKTDIDIGLEQIENGQVVELDFEQLIKATD